MNKKIKVKRHVGVLHGGEGSLHSSLRRFKVYDKGPFKGYRIHKVLFRVFFFACVALLVITGLVDGLSLEKNYYVSCPNTSIGNCQNPLYGLCDELACADEYLLPGVSYGSPPPFLLQNVGLFVIIIMGSFLILNHVFFNRNFEPGGDL